jgi:uncharacterized protein YdeI (YjbR/CyaY-like superfamily)
MVETKQDLPLLTCSSQAAWEAWLEESHGTSRGVWLRIARREAGMPTVTHDEAVEVALCFGWIDSQAASTDGPFWLQKFTPRGRRSRWSRINRDRAAQLIEQGRMRPAGLSEVERARADGRWNAAYEGSRTATVPEDLASALAANPAAEEFFATLDSRNRYSVLYRIEAAKKPETRARRIAQFVEMLGEHRKLYP